MDVAKKILSNYGWKEGEGLGRNRNGIAKPLKAKLKFDTAGFGADRAAADFNNHWWERVFNEAATNVNVKQEGEDIKMVLKDDEDGVEISTKGYSIKKLKKLQKVRGECSEKKTGYENFLRAATLTNMGDEVENSDKIDTDDIEVPKVKVLTDDELFKACGGRTAHKGARHGLKLSGKLSRIEQQETELLAKMIAKRNGLCEVSPNKNKTDEKGNNTEHIPVQKSKKGKKKMRDKEETYEEKESEMFTVKCGKSQKSKRKYSEVGSTEQVGVVIDELCYVKCKKKNKLDCDKEIETISEKNKKAINPAESYSDNIKSLFKKNKKRKREQK